jgi:CheY-like chemotaxis protein
MGLQSQTLLLAEDYEDDIFLFRHALSKAGINAPVQVVTNGQKAVDYLSGAAEYADRSSFPIPAIVFLDLKLPLLSGFEVLVWMKGQPTLAGIPVVILTGSSEERDKQRARELGVKGYYVKPLATVLVREIVDAVTPSRSPVP